MSRKLSSLKWTLCKRKRTVLILTKMIDWPLLRLRPRRRNLRTLLPALDDESKLDHCYNIGTKVEKVEARHSLYNMHAVFTIVVPEENGKTLKEEAYNLYTEYATITPDMVAASNKRYNSWPKGPTWQENLNWTHQFFEYNVAPEVAEKVNKITCSILSRLVVVNYTSSCWWINSLARPRKRF